MRNLLRPSFLLVVLLLALVPSTLLAHGSEDEALRARIVDVYIELLPFEIQSLLDQEIGTEEDTAARAMAERLRGLVEELPDEEQAVCKEDFDLYFRGLTENHAPESMDLLDEVAGARLVSTTMYYLSVVRDALALHLISFGQYPGASEGLASMLEESNLDEEMLVDAWGNALQYEINAERGEDRYRVVSMGPDGQLKTADDMVMTAADGLVHSISRSDLIVETLAPNGLLVMKGDVLGSEPDASYSDPAFVTTTLVASLETGEEPHLVRTGDSPSSTLVAFDGPNGRRVLRGGVTVVLLPEDSEIYTHTDGVFAYLLDSEEGRFLHRGERRVRIGDYLESVAFLEGSDKMIYSDGDDWYSFDTGGSVSGEPAFDLGRRLHAFRELVEDEWFVHTTDSVFGPLEWASTPILLDRGEHRGHILDPKRWDVAFRLWDGESTEVHIGGSVWKGTWAGDPFVSADGERVGVLFNSGGQPVADFHERRDVAPLTYWQKKRGYRLEPAHELFEGGTFSAVLNGIEGPGFARILDPAFGPEGDDFVYRAQASDGNWHVVQHSAEGVVATEGTEEIGELMASPENGRLSYDWVQDGRTWLRTDGIPPVACDRVVARASGPRGSFAYVVEQGDEGHRLYWAHSETETDWLGEPLRSLELIGWVGADHKPVARGFSDGKQGFAYPGNLTLPFDGITEPVLPDPELGVERIAHLGWIDGQCKLVVHNTATGRIHLLDLEDRLTGARAPGILEDGRVYFVCSLDGEEMPYPQYELGSEGQACVVVFDDDEWFALPTVDHIYGVEVSAGGELAYTAKVGEQQRVDVLGREGFKRGMLYDKVEWTMLTFLGEEAMYPAGNEGKALIIGERAGPAGLAVTQLRVLKDGLTPAYSLSLEDDSFMVIGENTFGPFDSVSVIHEIAELGLLWFEASEGDWTRSSIVMVDNRPGESGARASVRLPYDKVLFDYGEWPNSYSGKQGPASLNYYALRGDRLERVELDLQAVVASFE